MELTIDQALQQGVAAHKEGKLQEAERLYRAILQTQPKHPDANHNLGVLSVSSGKSAAALPLFKTALGANPNQGQFWLSYIDALIKEKQFENAKEILAQGKKSGLSEEKVDALSQQLTLITQAEEPTLPEQKKSLTFAEKRKKLSEKKKKKKPKSPSQPQLSSLLEHYQNGRYGDAEQLALSMTKQFPRHQFSWKVLGAVLQETGRISEGLIANQKSVELAPQDAAANNNLGITLRVLGRLDEAEASYRQAISLKPDFVEAHYNLGVTLKELGRLEEAEASYRQAISLKPDYAEAHNNLGSTLRVLGRLEEAEASYRQAISLKPDFVKAHYNLGVTLKELGRLEEAEASYRQVISLKPDFAEAHNNLGSTLQDLGRLEEAEASYRQAISLKPDYAEAHSNLGITLQYLGRLEEAEASYRQAISLKPDFAEAHSNLLFLQSSCAFDSALYLKEALNYANAISKKISSRFAEWSCVKKPQRLRIGFVSGDFKNHPVGYFLEGLLTQLNPSSVELFAYPTHFIEDELTTRIKPCFASWTPLFDKSDKEAARLIHNDGVHILIDLSGHTANNRLPIFAWKPAPIQISWLGYWATTGVPEIDYVLGDPHVTPPQDDDHFTEKVWRLPETRWCFTPPDVDVEVSAPPALKQDYVTFGCFSNLTKINDKVVELWAKVLDAIPNSRLLLKAKQLRDQLVRESIIQRFAAQGINSKRISLEGSEDRQKYFAAYNRIDITLDSFPFTGGTTSVESLWMGVPLITLAGDSLISRQGVGVLTNTGLPDWIADDEESYLAKAIIFASDLDKLARLRANLRSQVLASPLFDAPRFARNFENALFEMWNQYAHQSRKKYP